VVALLLTVSGVCGALLPELGKFDQLLSEAARIVMKGVA
jgi:hydrogenase-4 component F